MLDVKVTLLPPQNERGPFADIEALGLLFTVILDADETDVHPLV